MILATEAEAEILAGHLLEFQLVNFRSEVADRLKRFNVELRLKFVEAGMRLGSRLSTLAVLEEVLGSDVVAVALLAGDPDPLVARVCGVEHFDPSASEVRRRRWKEPPLSLYHRVLYGVKIPFVVAAGKRDGAFGRHWLYDRATIALGATEEGRKTLRGWRHNGQRFRVLVEGRIERVFCMPEYVMLELANLLARNAAWTKSEAFRLHDEVERRVSIALVPTERSLRSSDI